MSKAPPYFFPFPVFLNTQVYIYIFVYYRLKQVSNYTGNTSEKYKVLEMGNMTGN